MSKEPVNNESDEELEPTTDDVATTKADAPADDKKKSKQPAKLTEKERIARSKEIAAKARGKDTGASRRRARNEAQKQAKAKAEKAKNDSMTKAQQRYSQPKTHNADADQNPVWFKPIMFGFLLLGLLWILVYYLSSAKLPVAELGDWNLLVGIGISLVGFLMMTNWK